MALNANDMKDYLIAQMNQAASQSLAHSRFTDAINSYVTSNIEIQGTYAGAIPGSPPVPVGGTFQFEGQATLQWSALMAAASACGVAHPDEGGYNLSPWVTAMQSQMRSNTEVVSSDVTSYVTHTGRDFSPLNLVLDFWTVFSGNTEAHSQDASLLYFCEQVCDAYWGTSLPSTPASAIDGSSGTITWDSIS